ncbi:MAG: NAD(+)/NADH kinase [Patescibacteria group bacterium]
MSNVTSSPSHMPQITLHKFTLGIFGKKRLSTEHEKINELRDIAKILEQSKFEIVYDENTAETLGKKGMPAEKMVGKVDFFITIGGDGTVLRSARLTEFGNVKLLPINTGNLGFMTEIRKEKLKSALQKIAKGNYTLEHRAVLSVALFRGKKELLTGTALNEAVISQGSFPRLVGMNIKINDKKIFDMRADGLIIATPTGSTGHSLSASGPVLHPEICGMIINPICPLNLSLRPIVVSENSRIEIEMLKKSETNAEMRLTLDGQVSHEVQRGDHILIKKSRYNMQFLRIGEKTYWEQLSEKLRW